jgi:anti-anti-sigma factor
MSTTPPSSGRSGRWTIEPSAPGSAPLDMEALPSENGVTRLRLWGRLDSTGADRVGERFTQHVVSGAQPTVVDLSGVSYVSSMGIRLLIASAKGLRKKGATMVLFGAQHSVRAVFEQAALDQILDIVPGQAEAMGRVRPVPEPASMAPLRLRLPADRGSVDDARQAVGRFLAPHGLSAEAVYRVELVLEEILLNVALHGRVASTPPWVEVLVELAPEDVVLRFEDEGIAFDPLQAAELPRPSTLDEAVPGGLGLVLVRRNTRHMGYERREGRNRLTLVVAR